MDKIEKKLDRLFNEFLSEYNPQIVSMDVFSKDKLNQITYKLLVVNNSFIIDYKIEFKSFSIKLETTGSHQESKKKNHSFILRKELIENVLGLKHKFVSLENHNKRKEQNTFNDSINLNKINDFLNDSKNELWRITFQNIIYILSGSNPSGESNGKGELTTYYLNSEVPFGLFLGTLNVCKKFRKQYCEKNEINQFNLTYLINKVYKWLENDKNLKLNDFLKFNPELDSFFKEFIKNSKDWKNIRQKMKDNLESQNKKFFSINSEIIKLRKEFTKEIQTKWSDPYFEFFNIEKDMQVDYEMAHIKPVYEIKNEYLKNSNKGILKQISDPYNFLPLTPNIHTMYDKYKLYWDYKTGELKSTNDNESLNNNEFELFKQLNHSILKEVKKYLKEYFNSVLKNKMLSC